LGKIRSDGEGLAIWEVNQSKAFQNPSVLRGLRTRLRPDDWPIFREKKTGEDAGGLLPRRKKGVITDVSKELCRKKKNHRNSTKPKKRSL